MDRREPRVSQAHPPATAVIHKPNALDRIFQSGRHVEWIHSLGQKPMIQRFNQRALAGSQPHSIDKCSQDSARCFFRCRFSHFVAGSALYVCAEDAADLTTPHGAREHGSEARTRTRLSGSSLGATQTRTKARALHLLI